MAKQFDVFLRRHLIECDILIQSLPYRDGISVTDRIIVDAVLQGCKLMRIAAAQSGIEVNAQIDRLIKTCLERLSLQTVMDASVDLKATNIAKPVNEPIVMDAKNLGTLETVLNRAEAGMVMAVNPLVTKIAKSLGQMNTGIVVGANVTDTLKKSILTLRADTTLDVEVQGELKIGLLDLDTEICMDATLASLCKRIGFDAVAGIEMAVTCLGTKLYHSLGRGYSGISVDAKVTGTKARKIETAETIVQIMADMSAVLIKLIYPEDVDVWIDAEVSESQLKRYRLMSDLGDTTLEDLGDMTLDDFYYIILAG